MFPESLAQFPEEIGLQVEYDTKYAGYISRQQVQVERQQRMLDKQIPKNFDYGAIVSLRNEARQKFSRIRPLNLDQAGRISGITPSDVALVLAYLENPRLRNLAQAEKEDGAE
jgi:tRNA uridine 5-carboxymethylaminomethyl modification enzyme